MEKLTNEEAEQYDRQIRLWGLEAQKRLRSSRVLVVGLRGLSAEVCKNIVLAGVKSLTILDHRVATSEDAANRFLVSKEGEYRALQAKVRLQVLNNNVDVEADTENVKDKGDDFFKRFDVICLTDCSTSVMLRLNELCRANGIKFFCGDVWGYYGYFFVDLQEHEYSIEIPKAAEDVLMVGEEPSTKKARVDNSVQEMQTIRKQCSFCSLNNALTASWSSKTAKYFKRHPATFFTIQVLQAFRDCFGTDPCRQNEEDYANRLLTLRMNIAEKYGVNIDLIGDQFTSYCFSELSPVCAIVGGVMAQEIIKAISAKDIPFSNCFLYDGVLGSGIVEQLGV